MLACKLARHWCAHCATLHAACHYVCAVLQGDQAFGASLALYMNNEGAANDGVHNPIMSFFQWAWDADADSTFGRHVASFGPSVQSGHGLRSTTELAGWVQTCCLGTCHFRLSMMPLTPLPGRQRT